MRRECSFLGLFFMNTPQLLLIMQSEGMGQDNMGLFITHWATVIVLEFHIHQFPPMREGALAHTPPAQELHLRLSHRTWLTNCQTERALRDTQKP